MTSERGPIVATSEMTLKFLRHPHDEFFDRCEAVMVERWKESELSGDEWRFSQQVRCYSHGVLVATVSGHSLRQAMGLAAARWSDLVAGDDEWMAKRDEIDTRCCQPGCDQPWTILYHPVKACAPNGAELARPYKDGTGGLEWLDVRGFCDRHKDRGDCALDDAEPNYVEVLAAPVPTVEEKP